MKNHVSSVWGICGGVCSIFNVLDKSPYLFTTPRVFSTVALIFGLILSSINAQQCPVPPFSNESEIFIQGLSTTIARTTDGFYIWGDSGSPNNENLAIPRKVAQDLENENGYNFQGEPLLMTLGDVNQFDGSPQIILLTTFGLYVWGTEGGVLRNADVTTSPYIQIPNLPNDNNNDGLPDGVAPEEVAQIAASSRVLTLLTNDGQVWINAFVEEELTGDGVDIADDTWRQPININEPVVLLKVNERTVFAVTENGDFYTWGRETLIGDGNGYSQQNTPQLMTSPFPGVVPASIAITNGKDPDEKTSYYALNPLDQKIYALGDNDMGQLGIGNEEIQFNWVVVQNPDNSGDLENVTFLAASDNGPGHPAVGAITADGTPYFWGDNNNSMLTGNVLPFYNLPRIPDGFIEGTDFATYISVSGNSIMVKKFGEARPCFAGWQTTGNVGNGTDIGVSQSITTLQCNLPTLPNPDDYCFNAAESELVTTKTVSNENPKEEDNIFYTLQVTNNGLGAASNVRVTDILPVGITFTETQNASGGSINTYDENTGLWEIGDLAVGETASIEIAFQVNEGTTGMTITNTLSGPAIADDFIDITTVGDDLDAEFTVQVDTDGDGVTDFDENNDGTNPNDYCSFNPVNVSLDPSPGFLADDCDGDGVTNGNETVDNTNIFNFCNFLPNSVSLPQSAEFLAADCDGDGFNNAVDCEPLNPNINPDTVWHLGVDNDDDGYFGSELSETQCESPGDGYSTTQPTIDDCDDSDPTINPDTVWYLGVDNDNDGYFGSELSETQCESPADGYSTEQPAINDCDDSNPNISPGTIEVPSNGIDDDCDSETPDENPNEDLDDDGFENDVDCDDTNPAINPGAEEIPYNGIDDDCNPDTPDDDIDGDGFNNDVDCDDTNASVNPGAEEIPFNDIDDDCNPNTPDVESEPFEIEIEIDNELVGPNIDSGFFRILNIESFPNNTVEIFNRWGIKVFETKGYDNGENNFRGISTGRGTLQPNAKLPSAVYFYVITYFNGNTPQRKVGYLYVQN